MARQLLVFFGADAGRVFALPADGAVTIGRGRDATIQLNDLQVSRLHCRLELAGFRIQDAGSVGGTFINGLRITEQFLKNGDTIRIGGSEMRLQVTDLTDQPTLMPVEDDETGPAAIPLAQPAPLATPVNPLAHAVKAAAPVAAIPVAVLPAAVTPGAAGPAGLTGRLLGPYEVGPQLAQGHSGLVFRGRDTRSGQDVALKVLWPHLANNPEMVQRLERSAKIMLPIRHPNLVSLYATGQSGGYAWLAMEYIEGENLTQVIERIGIAGMLDWRHAFRVAVHMGRALQTIHEQHIIHRNLAPQNVLIRAEDKSAVLSDVVLAKAFEGVKAQDITRPGEILGDYRYLRPEQVTEGNPVDARADIYCLGAMLYALLTGRPPLVGGSLLETITMIRNVQPARPKKYQMSIGDRFEGVVLKMLVKKPDGRFQTAAELLEELERVARLHGIKVP